MACINRFCFTIWIPNISKQISWSCIGCTDVTEQRHPLASQQISHTDTVLVRQTGQQLSCLTNLWDFNVTWWLDYNVLDQALVSWWSACQGNLMVRNGFKSQRIMLPHNLSCPCLNPCFWPLKYPPLWHLVPTLPEYSHNLVHRVPERLAVGSS